ncbi:MAG: hypothetical protein JNL58_31765 [Planctomyces sp.]|nr:hypothetical protein [Planctomyces sp.]
MFEFLLLKKGFSMQFSLIAKLVLLLSAVICTNFSATLCQAQDVERTPRFFFHFLPLDNPDAGANWQATGSQRIVVQGKNTVPETVLFGSEDNEYTFSNNFEIRDSNGNLILNLRGTTWSRASVVHITEDGVEKVDSAYWLIKDGEDITDLKGLTAATGPDGDVTTVENISLGSAEDNTLFLLRNNGNPVRFSLGWFNK